MNLIFVEGVSGVGKSTTTTALCKKLRDMGYSTACYLEGDINSPVDSFWSACLTKAEYDHIRLTYRDFAYEISDNGINGDNYILVRYQDLKRKYYSPELYEYLKEREFCYNPARPLPLVNYMEVFSDIWRRFAKSVQTTRDIVILDGSFLHHQINDLIRNYNATEDDIVRHLAELLRSVRSLNPVVFYLSSQEVGDRLRKAQDSRGKSEPTKKEITFWEKRKDMDLRVLNELSVESHIVDVTCNNWDTVLDTIIWRVTQNAPIAHYSN
ncbi:MAG: hypothetical protein VB111_07140 [Clostridiaceae bacterium]|nr:hypothetical protein [Clostridiaceae bacterium]